MGAVRSHLSGARAVGVVPFFNPSFPTVLAVLEDSHQTEFL
jgi:hypothetical protein